MRKPVLYIGFLLEGIRDQALPRTFSENVQLTQRTDTCEYEVGIFDLLNASWRQLLEWLAFSGFKFLNLSTLTVVETEFDGAPRCYDWTTANEDCIAAVLAGDENSICVPTNREEDFAIKLAPPCYGRIKSGLPLQIAEEPSCVAAWVGGEVIISTDLLDRCNLVEGSRTEVRIANRTSSKWVRYLPNSSRRIIDEASILPTVDCAICGAPYTPALGIWIAKHNHHIFGRICSDELGIGHLRNTKPIVVSRDLATELQRHFGKDGYNLSPIYRDDCELVVELCEFMNGLNTLVGG